MTTLNIKDMTLEQIKKAVREQLPKPIQYSDIFMPGYLFRAFHKNHPDDPFLNAIREMDSAWDDHLIYRHNRKNDFQFVCVVDLGDAYPRTCSEFSDAIRFKLNLPAAVFDLKKIRVSSEMLAHIEDAPVYGLEACEAFGSLVYCQAGFISGLTLHVIQNELDGLHDDPLLFQRREDMIQSFEGTTGFPYSEKESAYDDFLQEQGEDGVVVCRAYEDVFVR